MYQGQPFTTHIPESTIAKWLNSPAMARAKLVLDKAAVALPYAVVAYEIGKGVWAYFKRGEDGWTTWFIRASILLRSARQSS